VSLQTQYLQEPEKGSTRFIRSFLSYPDAIIKNLSPAFFSDDLWNSSSNEVGLFRKYISGNNPDHRFDGLNRKYTSEDSMGTLWEISRKGL
jgi:hypothetical protein